MHRWVSLGISIDIFVNLADSVGIYNHFNLVRLGLPIDPVWVSVFTINVTLGQQLVGNMSQWPELSRSGVFIDFYFEVLKDIYH